MTAAVGMSQQQGWFGQRVGRRLNHGRVLRKRPTMQRWNHHPDAHGLQGLSHQREVLGPVIQPVHQHHARHFTRHHARHFTRLQCPDAPFA